MAKKIIKAHMKQRRDTKANWASVNPVLLDGELGIVSDDPNLYKVGDGATAWNDLPFRGFDGTLAQELGTSPNAVISQQVVSNEIVTLQNDLSWTQDEQQRIESETKAGLQDLQKTTQKKADQDGKYPELTAGFANNLVGRGEAVDATINFRPSGGTSIEDGAARVKELKGNSVVWNQGFRAADFPDTATSFWYGQHADISIVDGVCRMVATEEGARAIYQNFQIPFGGTGHKVMVVCDFKRYSSASEKFYVYLVLEDGASEMSSQHFSDTNRRREVAFLTLTSGIKDAGIYPHLNGAVGDVVDLYSLTIYDLTQMFGEGNEPSTIEEFYNRIPQNVDLYAYNEGEIVSTNAEGIKSVGFNVWDEECAIGNLNAETGEIGVLNVLRSKNYIPVIGGTSLYFPRMVSKVVTYDENKQYIGYVRWGGPAGVYTLPINCRYILFDVATDYGTTYNHDICINLSHSGYRNGEYQPYMQFIRNIDSRIREAFPNGMKSAGNASDKVYNKNGKGYIERHIGVVDLGSLNWAYIAPVMGASVPGIFRPTTYAERIDGLLCENYIVDTKISLDDSATNKSIKREGGSVYIKDTAYTDAATFKAAMSGVMLYYELAKPEILEFDEPFNLDYEVWDFGTEQMIATEPSAPIKASIVYGFNAVDSVRTAQLEIAELKTQIAQMQTIMASLTAQPAMIKE